MLLVVKNKKKVIFMKLHKVLFGHSCINGLKFYYNTTLVIIPKFNSFLYTVYMKQIWYWFDYVPLKVTVG